MITQQQCRRIIDSILDYGQGKVDATEVTISASDVATSRFANNEMTQNQAPYTINVSVRVQKDGRQARASAYDISPVAAGKLVRNAMQAAALLEKDPDMLPLYSPDGESGLRQPDAAAMPDGTAGAQAPGQRHSATARIGPAERAAAVRQIIGVASNAGLNAAGYYASGSSVSAIGNSNGLFKFYEKTEAECSITMTGSGSSGWAKANQWNANLIDPRQLANTAAGKAIAGANPVELPPGHYTVILEPPAVLDLVGFLWYDFTGTSYNDKLSCFLGKLGQKVFGDSITIVDDCTHPMQAGEPFDGEGVARRRVTLVENGWIKQLVYGRKSARQLGAEPTGHGLPEPSSYGEWPLNLVVSGGTTAVEDMIATTERGILLTRVWYVREVDPMTKIMTGMTRDGTFLVEGGTIKSGAVNLRFNVSLIEMLNQVVALGPSQRTAGEEGFPAVVPAMKVSKFNFSSVTRQT